MLNLDAAGGMSNSGSMEDIARGLVASKTAGEAWTGASAVMPDVSVLQEFIDPDEEQDEEAEKNSEDDEDDVFDDTKSRASKSSKKAPSSAQQAPPSAKKAKGHSRWWDRDDKVATVHKKLNITAEGFRALISQVHQAARDCRQTFEHEPKVTKIVANEVAILDCRLNALTKVGGHTGGEDSTPESHREATAALRTYIASVRTAQEARRSGGSSSNVGRARFGEAPPSQNFMDLVTIQDTWSDALLVTTARAFNIKGFNSRELNNKEPIV